MRVDDSRAHSIIGSADTDVESRHNSYGQALLQRTQVQKISTCNSCILRQLALKKQETSNAHSTLKIWQTYLNNKLNKCQIPWDIRDPEIRGLNALELCLCCPGM